MPITKPVTPTWEEKCRKKLLGRKIVEVRYLNKKEMDDQGWDRGSLAIFFDDGSYIYPSQDDEGNGPGALFTSWDDLPIIPVIHEGA